MKGKTVLITGANSGIGLVVAARHATSVGPSQALTEMFSRSAAR